MIERIDRSGSPESALNRHECRHRLRDKLATSHLTPPVPKQPAADLMSASHFGKRRAGLLDLGNDPQLLLKPPPAPTLNAGDDLYPATRP